MRQPAPGWNERIRVALAEADERLATAPPALVCANPAGWHPTLHTINRHHHPPIAWRVMVVPEPWWRIIDLCGLCHDEVHTLLNLYVHRGGQPPWAERRSYSPFIRSLVEQCWQHRPDGRPPYTVADGASRLMPAALIIRHPSE